MDAASWAASETITAAPFSGSSSFCVSAETAIKAAQDGAAATTAAGSSSCCFFCAAEITEATADADADASQISKRQRLTPLPFSLSSFPPLSSFFFFFTHTFQIYLIKRIPFQNKPFLSLCLSFFFHFALPFPSFPESWEIFPSSEISFSLQRISPRFPI